MKSKEKIYLMGIAGTAMASLAGLLQDLGFETAGSDAQIYPPMSTALENLGIEILTPYSPDNLMKTKPDWVVIGNVISENHPEAQYVLSNNIKYLSLPTPKAWLLRAHTEKQPQPQFWPIACRSLSQKTINQDS